MGLLDRFRGPGREARQERSDEQAPAAGAEDTGSGERSARVAAATQQPDEVAGPEAPEPRETSEAEAPPEDGPSRSPGLLRHSPFSVGFFGAVGALVAFFLVQQVLSISSVLTLLVMALFLAAGLNPLVEWFMRHGVRRGGAVLVVLVMVFALFGLFVVALAPVISEQIATITANAPRWLRELQANDLVQRMDAQFDLISRVEEYVSQGDFGQQAFGGAVGVGLAVLSALANTLIVLVLTIYFLVSLPSITRAIYRLAPASRRQRVSQLGDRIVRSTGAYVAGAALVAVCAGLSTLVFTFLVGLGDYSFALAFVVGLLSLIPIVGSIISGVLITALGLTVSPTVAIIALVYYLAYQQLEAYVIHPRIMSRSVEVPGAVTVIAALAGGSLLGVVGAVLAVPVAAALLLLHREVFLKRQDAR